MPIQDVLGATLGLVNSAGSLATTFSYEPFGKPTPGNNAYPYLFAGIEYDPPTGLYHTLHAIRVRPCSGSCRRTRSASAGEM